MAERPEHLAPAELFYGMKEASKYSNNTRIIEIQTSLTERALQLLAFLPSTSALLLDIGCGSGISGEVLTEAGHSWVGVDIAEYMLQVAMEREVEGDLLKHDMGQGLPFRPGTFDAAVSISAIQWLCSAEKKIHNPIKRMNLFFMDLYKVLVRGARCAFQFYPENANQVEMLTHAALKNGFTGGIIVDYPNSAKAKKYFLFLVAGYSKELSSQVYIPDALVDEEEEKVEVLPYRKSHKKRGQIDRRNKFKTKDWVIRKKERQIRQGKMVRHESKYSGKKRKDQF